MKLDLLQKPYLKEGEVAYLLNISVHKLQKDRRKGIGLSYHRLGRAIRYSSESIKQYLSENSFRSTSEYGGDNE